MLPTQAQRGEAVSSLPTTHPTCRPGPAGQGKHLPGSSSLQSPHRLLSSGSPFTLYYCAAGVFPRKLPSILVSPCRLRYMQDITAASLSRYILVRMLFAGREKAARGGAVSWRPGVLVAAPLQRDLDGPRENFCPSCLHLLLSGSLSSFQDSFLNKQKTVCTMLCDHPGKQGDIGT